MLIDEYHPEDIKAEIRKRFGSLLAFERAFGLAYQSTTEVLRGRKRPAAEAALRKVLAESGKWSIGKAIKPGVTSLAAKSHQQNERAA